ncbi:MAG: YncE family protein [Betaproteobacteria bacterium]|nr:YncE family protein [Betaproteobacteria bacterium]
MKSTIAGRLLCGLFLGGLALTAAAGPAYLLNGLDEKVGFDNGSFVFRPPGHDGLTIVDIGTNPAHPRIVTTLPLQNSLFGPPVNLQVAPDQSIALLASAMQSVSSGDGWKPVPDNRLFVVDLRSDPPSLKQTIELAKQPSGLAISRKGDLALVAHRADKAVSVLKIANDQVSLVQTVPMDDEVAAVAITPDGRRALAVKNSVNKVAVLSIDGDHVTYDKSLDMPVGQFPYNIDITPDGSAAVVAHTGNGGKPDGQADPLAVIDLTQSPPRVVQYVTAGDAPEAFAISPRGDIAVALLLGGSILPASHWAHANSGKMVVFTIDYGRLTRGAEIPVGQLPEGVAFSADGRYLYMSQFFDQTLRVFRVEGGTLVDTNTRIELPGHPGSMRARPN